MKTLWLYSIRAYLRLGLSFYFKNISVNGLEQLPKDKAVLIVSNHQNALLDALLIATRLPKFGYFLTRAGVFKKAFVAKILASLNMLPVYRIRDGWNNLTNNNSVFESVTELFHHNKTVIIFPEGSHNLARRVRPLSKGFTRVVFDTIEKYPDTELSLLPVGLNFLNAEDFVDSAAIYIGQPINAKRYITENRNEGVIALKRDVHNAISNLTTHIPEEHYNETLRKLEALKVDFLNPREVNQCIVSNFNDCKSKPKSKTNGFKRFLKFLLILSVLPPYLIWKYVVEPKINEIEFTSTFRFAIAIVLVPIYLLILGFVLYLLFGFKITLITIASILILELLTVKL